MGRFLVIIKEIDKIIPFFLQMSKWIKVIWVSLYLEMIKYIRKLEKKSPCTPDFENVLLNRSRGWTVSARLLWSLRTPVRRQLRKCLFIFLSNVLPVGLSWLLKLLKRRLRKRECYLKRFLQSVITYSKSLMLANWAQLSRTELASVAWRLEKKNDWKFFPKR